MKVAKIKGEDERRILIGMITDRVACAKIADRWTREGLFRSKWANLVGGWCCMYHRRYSEPPGQQIESMFRSWAGHAQRDEKMAEAVGRFLGSLSDEYEHLKDQNSEYLVDLAGKHFQRVALENLTEEVQADLDFGDESAALERVQQFGKIELGGGAGVDPFRDEAAIRAVFEEQSESLIQWPSPLDQFFGNAFERDAFLAFQAPEKRGKTWFLLDVAWQAMRSKRRVAFFEIGDMSEKQVMKRILTRASKMPFTPQTVKKPIKIWREDEGEGRSRIEVEHEEVEYDEVLSWHKAMAACEKITRGQKETRWKLSCHPMGSLSVDGMRSILLGWERDGWVPDVIVIDYADNLEPPAGKNNEFRHQTGAVWKLLRRVSQELHVCLVTATQANAASYETKVMTKSNFSETKVKLAVVTGFIGLNQTREEKEKGIMRLNWIERREAEYNEFACLNVAGCLALGRPYVVGCF